MMRYKPEFTPYTDAEAFALFERFYQWDHETVSALQHWYLAHKTQNKTVLQAYIATLQDYIQSLDVKEK